MKKRILAALLIALFGVAFTADAAEPTATPNQRDKVRPVEPADGKGVVVQGNQLKAALGYVLEKASNKRVLARPAGGGIGHTLECACQGGTGNCSVGFTDDTAVCFTSEAAPCSGKCAWDVKSVRSRRITPR